MSRANWRSDGLIYVENNDIDVKSNMDEIDALLRNLSVPKNFICYYFLFLYSTVLFLGVFVLGKVGSV